MSERSDNDATALKHEYENLSKEAAALASTLARRRADIALMRAEAATVAVSLESAKDQLDTALRREAVIRSDAQQLPKSETSHPDFLPDQGLIRALAGQLEVTLESVKAAKQKRTSLRDEIHELESTAKEQDAIDGVASQIQTKLEVSGGEGLASTTENVNSYKDEGNTAGELSKRNIPASVYSSVEENALQILQEGSESQSSFRFDHARIWRDVTMPNLTLVQNDPNESKVPSTTLGVVTERIFEGVTCFTPTDAAKGNDGAMDLRIDSCGEIECPSEALSELVAEKYGTLVTTSKESGAEVRLIAPKVALERVADLVNDQAGDAAKRRHLSDTENSDDIVPSTQAKTEQKTIATDPAQSPVDRGQDSEERKLLEHLTRKVSSRRSGRSEILTDEQFAKIISAGVPARFQESGLDLVYSTDVHGMSLHTLYHRAAKSSPTLVVIRTTRNRMLGCYATHPWKSSATRYYGSGECFAFGTPNPETLPKVYKWSRLNSFFQFTSGTFLAIGGGAGSHFALWIDEDLLMGTTSACSTFESPPLTDTEESSREPCREFKILSLEVWSFVAHRRH